jgi:hypothetical protein
MKSWLWDKSRDNLSFIACSLPDHHNNINLIYVNFVKNLILNFSSKVEILETTQHTLKSSMNLTIEGNRDPPQGKRTGFQFNYCHQLGQSLWCQNQFFFRFLLLNKLNRTALKLMSSSISFFLRSSSIFHFFKSHFFLWEVLVGSK